MVMPPKIPIGLESHGLGKWAKITIFRLTGDEFCDHVSHLLSERRVSRQAQSLDGGEEVFANKFPRPGHEVRRRLSVPQLEHLQHPRVGLRGTQKPLTN